jgi:hypothetical protein
MTSFSTNIATIQMKDFGEVRPLIGAVYGKCTFAMASMGCRADRALFAMATL